MSRLATRRLIDAAAELEPAERALLNLWVNRGFDDPALARMTGLTIDALAARRELIVGRLSDELGLPPDRVRSALRDIFDSAVAERERHVADQSTPEPEHARPRPAEPADAGGEPQHSGQAPPKNTDLEATLAAPTADSSPVSAPATPAAARAPPLVPDDEQPPALKRRRSRRLVLGLLLILIAVTLLIALGGGGKSASGSRSTSSRPAPSTSSAPPSSPSTSLGTSRTSPARVASHPLASLPGGLTHASGSVQTNGAPGHLNLRLSLRGLPAKRRGHYEVWLYNSILDSTALGRVPRQAASVTFALPRNAHRFRWIDVSFQPRGVTSHSGESRLRAANPAAARP